VDDVEDRYMNTVDLRNYISVSKATLWKMMKEDNTMPKPFKIGERSLRWKKSEIDNWLEKMRS
jgi:predicted DNA-binding transcriptional regulator AlpA